MHVHDQILQFVEQTGPTTPTKVAKKIGTEILIGSAHLADLSSQRKVRISNLKIGGSPLYYLPGQEDQLYAFAAGNMNPKNLEVLEKLKEKVVLREEDLSLLEKVALRALKDFAVPLQVRTQIGVTLFWKWHLAEQDEMNAKISEILQLNKPIPQVTEPEPVQEEKREEIFVEQQRTLPTEKVVTPEITKEEAEAEVEVTKELEQESEAELIKEDQKPKLKAKSKSKPKKEELIVEELISEVKPELKEPVEEVKPVIIKKQKTANKDPFLPVIEEFCQSLKIGIHDVEIVRKNAELNLIISVPGAIGTTKYFCKAKSKKRCDEKDISAAYMESQIKKLPLLFLYQHNLTPKAEEMLGSEVFQNAVTKKIE